MRGCEGYSLSPQMFRETAKHYDKAIEDCRFVLFGYDIVCTNKLLVGRKCEDCDTESEE